MPQFRMRMYNTLGRGVNPFDPPKAEIVTVDADKFVAWVVDFEAKGWLSKDDHDAHLNMLRGMAARRRSELSKPYNPSPEQVALDRAHKPSGKGQKPFRKPVRDYKGNPKPGKWESVLPSGPDSPRPSTKRFPHLGGQTGPQSRGES